MVSNDLDFQHRLKIKMDNVETEILPFLKWAGGKRWLALRHRELFPVGFNRYIEPFLGSGAVFFSMRPTEAILSDVNDELITTYLGVRDEPARVLQELKKHDQRHCSDYYYQMRSYRPRAIYTRAARFIYLNRTCWNGLYRVNLRGEFNVPIGTKTRAVLLTDNFPSVADLLNKAKISKSDFEATIDRAEKGDFLFVDPPYTVKHNHNGFVKYNETLFSWDDQIRLGKALLRAKRRGASILMTNADHQSVRDLYKSDFELMSIERPSVISGTTLGRSPCRELIVRG